MHEKEKIMRKIERLQQTLDRRGDLTNEQLTRVFDLIAHCYAVIEPKKSETT